MTSIPSLPSMAPDDRLGSFFTDVFIREIQAVSPGNLRALWIPSPADTLTNILKPDGRTWTNSASIAGRVTYQGNGILVSFNGTSQYVSTPDTNNLSYGSGAADSAHSAVVLVNAGTVGVGSRYELISKTDGVSNQEYNFTLEVGQGLRVRQWDQSAGANCRRDSNAGVGTGLMLLGFTNTAATGGATAANDIVIYKNGAAVASTATNSGSYVAMENLAAAYTVGARADGAANFAADAVGFVADYAAALTAAQHAQIASIASRYYGVALS